LQQRSKTNFMKTTTRNSAKPKHHLNKSSRKIVAARKGATDIFSQERAIFVVGEISDVMVSALTPKIIALTQSATLPITLFIDSDGGSVRAASVIRGLLKTPDRRGNRCPLITIVTGRACSSAADLLAEGDYIAAYQHAYIHFHGTRISDVAVTAEEARELEKNL